MRCRSWALSLIVVYVIGALWGAAQHTSGQESRSEFRSQTVGRVLWKSGAGEVYVKDSTAKRQTIEDMHRSGYTHLVVHATQPVTSSLRSEFEGVGLTLQSPLGGDFFYAQILPDANPDEIASLATIDAIERIRVPWKLHPVLLAGTPPEHSFVIPESPEEPLEIALQVVFHEDVEKEAIPELIARHGGSTRSILKSINVAIVTLPAAAVQDLAREDSVQWLEPPLPALEGALHETLDRARCRVEADVVSESPYDLDGTNITLLVFDGESVDDTHWQLVGRVNVWDGHIPPDPFTPHATNVAIIAGGQPSPLTHDDTGMAQEIAIESYVVESMSGTPYAADAGDLEADYDEAINVQGADLSNNSIGLNIRYGYSCSWYGYYGVTASLLDAITAGGLGAPFRVIWAGGNERENAQCIPPSGYGSIPPPVNAKNPISVGAVGRGDYMTSYSSFGPTGDGRLKPELCAPSEHIMGGTSSSAPVVAGLSALLMQHFRSLYPMRPDFLNSTLKVLLTHGATDIYEPGPDYRSGFGLAKVVPAADLLSNGSFLESAVGQGEVSSLALVVPDGTAEVKVTLAWDDAPATPGVQNALINDLDLKVYGPTGARHYPWTLDPLNPSDFASQTQEDHDNNIEQVAVVNPVPGVWQVQVHGTNVPIGPQSYSLALTPYLSNWYVNAAASGPQHDGTTPDTGFLTIQDAVDAAADYDTVLVLPGTYSEAISFLGKAVRVRSQNGPQVTVIDGGHSAACVSFANGEDRDSVLEGFKIQNGFGTNGGGIVCLGSSPTIRGNLVVDNSADLGAGLYAGPGASPELLDNEFWRNSATHGGGIYCAAGSSPVIEENLLTVNSAGSGDGGAIYCELGSSARISRNSATQNQAEARGGAVFCQTSGAAFRDNYWAANTAASGGGLHLLNCAGSELAGETIAGNAAATIGGGLVTEGNSPDLHGISVIGNQAATGGGVVFIAAGTPDVCSLLVAGNASSTAGAGVYCDASSPRLINATIANNTAGTSGGGLACYMGSSPTVVNSVLWGNSAAQGESVFVDVGSPTVEFSDVQGGWPGTGNFDLDPLFTDAGDGDYHLSHGSPCLDAGDTAIAGLPELDFDGDPRVVNAHVDIGADEHAFIRVPEQYASIQAAVNAAVDGTTVLVGPGAYTASYGEYLVEVQGKDIYVKSTDGPAATVLVGSTDRSTVAFTRDYIPAGSAYTYVPTGLGAGVEGFTITHPNYNGEGVYVSCQCSATIKGNIIEGNGSLGNGGGIHADLWGTGTVHVLDNVIRDNESHRGGGIALYGGEAVRIAYNVITDNRAVIGAGIWDECGALIENNVISENTVIGVDEDDEGIGGGIALGEVDYPVAAIVRNNVILSNVAAVGGGVGCYPESSVELLNNVIAGNAANMFGAFGGYGGGIQLWGSSSHLLRNNTVFGNYSAYTGGGIRSSPASFMSAQNNVFWANTAPDRPQVSENADLVMLTYSDIQGGWIGTGNIDTDPLFVDPAANDFQLLAGSPCIDAGDPATGLDVDGTRRDMGALAHCRPPLIGSIVPSWGSADGGTSVTITGAGFTQASTVFFGDQPAASVTLVNATTLEVISPALPMTPPRTGSFPRIGSPSMTGSPSTTTAIARSVSVDVTVDNSCASDTSVDGFSYVFF